MRMKAASECVCKFVCASVRLFKVQYILLCAFVCVCVCVLLLLIVCLAFVCEFKRTFVVVVVAVE